MDFVKRLPEIYKALVAFLGALAAQEGTVMAIADGLPPNWVHGLMVGFAGLTAFLTWLKKNKAAMDLVEKILHDGSTDPVHVEAVVKANPELVQELIDQYRTSH
ncbi:holin [Mycobacterium phage prophiGD54-2]|uniref:hypothetical protein n=1 Tax=Mycobacteroides TaxID=670516 RepID=UPI0013E8DC15|nr:hypothetical protein [Mycobacteroides abscessus]NGX08765.1 hypothetical protein [Mycobacteroides franklinii]QSM04648.1 holin [Mycobacterium phage prophiGD54-2]QSN19651.1 hypothetical protein I3U41_17230 [Mycobacteroides abscessus subsp. abscessus]